jgi:hypothetical protein
MDSPHKILCLKGTSNLKIQLKLNGQKTVVHSNRMKPYIVAEKIWLFTQISSRVNNLHQRLLPLSTFP